MSVKVPDHHVPRTTPSGFGMLAIIAAVCLIIASVLTVYSSSSLMTNRFKMPPYATPWFSKKMTSRKNKAKRSKLRRETADSADGYPVSDADSIMALFPSPPSTPLPTAQRTVDMSSLLSTEEFEELQRLVDFTRRPPEREHGDIQRVDAAGQSVCPLKRRLIFALTTGHTGTLWLVRILRCSKCAGKIEHEPKPSIVMFPELLREGRDETHDRREELKLQLLLENIHNGTADAVDIGLSGYHTYAETSHMFIKSWWDVLMNWLEKADPTGELYQLDFLVVRRHLSFVIRSFLTDRMFWDPAFNVKTSTGGEYTLHHRHMAILPPLFQHGALDSIDEIIGYLADMELQIARFRSRFSGPQFRYWDVRAEELFTAIGAYRLLRDMGMAPYNDFCMFQLTYARPVNQHVSWKSPELMEVDPQVFTARVLLFQKRYEALGIPFPHLPQLQEAYQCNTTAVTTAWCEKPVPDLSVAELQDILVAHPAIPRNLPPVKPLVPLWKWVE
jgi:hypothetical protein